MGDDDASSTSDDNPEVEEEHPYAIHALPNEKKKIVRFNDSLPPQYIHDPELWFQSMWENDLRDPAVFQQEIPIQGGLW